MNVLDYVILALAIAGFVLGLFKGFIKLTLTAIGVVIVAALTATIEPYVQNWFVNTSMDEGTRNVVSMIATVILLTVAYGLVAYILTKLLRKIKIIGFLDRVLGGVVGFAVVYMVFALFFALLTNTNEAFLPHLKSSLGEAIQNSWIASHVYKHNFFGEWIINGIAQKLIEGLQSKTDPEALAGLVALIA